MPNVSDHWNPAFGFAVEPGLNVPIIPLEFATVSDPSLT